MQKSTPTACHLPPEAWPMRRSRGRPAARSGRRPPRPAAQARRRARAARRRAGPPPARPDPRDRRHAPAHSDHPASGRSRRGDQGVALAAGWIGAAPSHPGRPAAGPVRDGSAAARHAGGGSARHARPRRVGAGAVSGRLGRAKPGAGARGRAVPAAGLRAGLRDQPGGGRGDQRAPAGAPKRAARRPARDSALDRDQPRHRQAGARGRMGLDLAKHPPGVPAAAGRSARRRTRSVLVDGLAPAGPAGVPVTPRERGGRPGAARPCRRRHGARHRAAEERADPAAGALRFRVRGRAARAGADRGAARRSRGRPRDSGARARLQRAAQPAAGVRPHGDRDRADRARLRRPGRGPADPARR